MAKLSEQLIWGTKRMKRLVFALTVVAALTLAACGSSNQDQVSNAELCLVTGRGMTLNTASCLVLGR
jgi:predicted lipoprotein with Yx(FWY)xxD motif